MHKAGRWAIYTGIFLVAIGLLVGFSAMFMHIDGIAILALQLIPIGFIVLLAGTVATQLSQPVANDETTTTDHEKP